MEAGSRIKHYRIVARLGEGGMGVVYRAEDTRLGRTVALKVLPEDLAGDEERSRRFEREARAASSISHPGVATLYDFDREGDLTFLTMEYVEGKTLREHLASGPLPLDRLLDAAQQVAEALASAHARGVIHRDLKPENVMASDSGFYKILDFGLARVTEPPEKESSSSPTQLDTVSREMTRAGKLLGTVTYMSPEQAQGLALDVRSDIFSLGSLLYEMAVGKPPFRRQSEIATFHAIVHENPAPLAEARPELPPEFERILAKCLAKDPGDRYQTAADLAVDLRALRRGSDTGSRSVPSLGGLAPHRPRRWPLAVALGGLAVVLALAVLVGERGRSLWAGGSAAPAAPAGVFVPADRNRIAVAYFSNNSGDPEVDWLSRGLPDMLTTDLTRSEDLEVISTQRLFDLLAAEGGREQRMLDETTVTELARRAGAGVVITGSIFKGGDDYRIDVQAYDTDTGAVVTAASVSGRDVFQMVDWLSADLRKGLQFSGIEGGDIRTITTASEKALRHHVRAMELYHDLRLTEAAGGFREALAEDPEFALAQLHLGMTLYLAGDRPEGIEWIEKAAARASGLPVRERLLVEAFEAFFVNRDFLRGDERLQELVDRYPQDKEGYFWRAQALAGLAGDREGAIRMLRRVLELDPGFALAATALGAHLMSLDRLGEAERELNAFLEKRPEAYAPRLVLTEVLESRGEYDRALDQLDRVARLRPEEREHRLFRPYILTSSGDYEGAREAYEAISASDDPVLRTAGHRGKADVMLYRGRFRDAVGALKKALETAVSTGDTLTQASLLSAIGGVLMECGEHDEALASFRRAAEVNPSSLAALGMARVHLRRGELERAAKVWSELEATMRERITPEMVEQYEAAYNANVAFYTDDFDGAEESFRRARSLSGLPATYAFEIGRALQEQGRHDEALEELRRVVRPSTRDKWAIHFVEAWFYMGRSLEASDRGEEALEAYRTFLAHWGSTRDRLHLDLIGEARDRMAALSA